MVRILTDEQKAAKAARGRIYRLENKEKITASARKYYRENKDKIEEYRQLNKERGAVLKREHYDRNCEAIKARELTRYYANKEAISERNRQRYKENRDAVRERQNSTMRARYASDADYRARRRASAEKRAWQFTADCTYEMIVELRMQDCFYCGNEGGSVDHLVPKSKGGEDRLDNLGPCCITCNSSKGTSDLEDFYRRTEIATA